LQARFEVHFNQLINHLAFPIMHDGHVNSAIVLGYPEFPAPVKVRSNLRALNDILARQARDVGA
jgi:hypothetical protein